MTEPRGGSSGTGEKGVTANSHALEFQMSFLIRAGGKSAEQWMLLTRKKKRRGRYLEPAFVFEVSD
jgi:hypothetical protein